MALRLCQPLLQKDGQFLNGHDLFLKRVGAAYHAFIEDSEKNSRGKSMEDLQVWAAGRQELCPGVPVGAELLLGGGSVMSLS